MWRACWLSIWRPTEKGHADRVAQQPQGTADDAPVRAGVVQSVIGVLAYGYFAQPRRNTDSMFFRGS